MSALPMNFDFVLATFQHPQPITCIDTMGGRVDGTWTETETGRRDINAIVLAMTVAQLEFYREGESSVSGISLHTKETLYFTDVNDTGDGQERRQTYVEYQGYRFRVAGTGFMSGNTTFNIYNCVRYVQ